MLAFIDPEVGMGIVRSLSWGMIYWGIAHLVIYLIGEIFPRAYTWIKSEGLRKLFVGNANRLVWGLGGVVLLIFGGVFLFLAGVIERLAAETL